MKFLVVGDLHGASPRVPDREFDAVIVPGDVCSDDGIRPFVSEAFECFLEEGPDAPLWWELADDPEALLQESVDRGREIMARLDSLGVPVFAVPGNWDPTGDPESAWPPERRDWWSEEVVAGLDNVVDVDELLFETEGLSFIGYGRVNGPELLSLRGYDSTTQEELAENERDYEELIGFYRELFSQASNPVVFLSHDVPYGTSLDVIDDPQSPRDGEHYGSVLARDLIREFSPLLCVGGHIHEHHGTDVIGETVCLNAGFGPDKASIVTVEDGEVSVELID